MRTLREILVDVNAVVDLSAQQPSGTELLTRSNYANQAVLDASATGQLSEFKNEYLTGLSTLATVSLPQNFRELQEWPRVLTNNRWQEYRPIPVEAKYEQDPNSYFCYVLGNPSEGYNLVLNNLIPFATLSVIHQRYPSGMLTLTDICELPDPQYVVRKIESYVLYSRSDDRFNIAEGRAQQSLSNMMGREMKSETGQPRQTPATFRNPLQ